MQNELIDSTNSTFARRCNREWMHIWEAREKESKSGSGRERDRETEVVIFANQYLHLD